MVTYMNNTENNINTYQPGLSQSAKYGLSVTQTIRQNEAMRENARNNGLRFCYQIWQNRTGIIDLETGEQWIVEPEQLGWQYKQLNFKARCGMKIELATEEPWDEPC